MIDCQIESYLPQICKPIELLFSYGTLQHETVQLDLFARILKGKPDRLPGYKLNTIRICDPAFLQKGEEEIQNTLEFTGNENDSVSGMAFELTGDELLCADTYEPDNFYRKKEQLASGRKAWIYLAQVAPTGDIRGC